MLWLDRYFPRIAVALTAGAILHLIWNYLGVFPL